VEETGGKYDIDTVKGQSGSIVYLKNNGKMVGIHKGYDPHKNLNVCTMISSEMAEDLQKWMKELKVSSSA